MTTTLAPPPGGPRSTSRPTREPHDDWPIEAIALRREAHPRQPPGYTYVEPRRRFWLLDANRREAIVGSDAAFLVSFLIIWALSGVLAYFYGLWTLGPV